MSRKRKTVTEKPAKKAKAKASAKKPAAKVKSKPAKKATKKPAAKKAASTRGAKNDGSKFTIGKKDGREGTLAQFVQKVLAKKRGKKTAVYEDIVEAVKSDWNPPRRAAGSDESFARSAVNYLIKEAFIKAA